MSLSFLCDPRLQTLSFQACDLLRRIEEAYEHYTHFLDEHGRAPADPVLLRNFLYPLRSEIRHTHVARWFGELESALLVTVFESDRGLVFALTHGRQSLAQTSQPETPTPEVFRVIHNSGVDPPKKDSEITAVAAAASSSLDLLLPALKPFFPLLDLEAEYRKYYRKRMAEKKPAIAVHHNPKMLTFVKWCQQAAIPLPPPPKKIAEAPQPVITPSDDQPDMFDELAHKKFLAELEARKLRKATK